MYKPNNLSRCLYFFVAVGLGSQTAEARASTLMQVLASAYNQNLELLAQRAQLRVTDEDIAQAIAARRPTSQISVSNSNGYDGIAGGDASQDKFYSRPNTGPNVSFSITQPVYSGGRVDAKYQEARSNVSSGKNKLISTEQQIFLKIVTDYMKAVAAKGTEELESGSEAFLAAKLEATKAGSRLGTTDKQDVAVTASAYQEAVVQRAESQSEAFSALATLSSDAGVDIDDVQFEEPELELPHSEDEAITLSDAFNPDILSAEADKQVAISQIQEARAQAMPELALVLSYEHLENDSFERERENSASVKLQLSVPLYSGGLIASQTRAAYELVEVKEDNVGSARRAVESQIKQNWNRLEMYSASLSALLERVKSQKLALEGAIRQKEVGEKSQLDLISMQQDLLHAQVELLQLRSNHVVTEFTMLSNEGKLTAQSLGIHTPIYDPNKYETSVRGRW